MSILMKSLSKSSPDAIDTIVKITSQAISEKFYSDTDHTIDIYPLIYSFMVNERCVFKIYDDPSKPTVSCVLDPSRDIIEQVREVFDDIETTSYISVFTDMRFSPIWSTSKKVMIELMEPKMFFEYVSETLDKLIDMAK